MSVPPLCGVVFLTNRYGAAGCRAILVFIDLVGFI